MDSFFQERVAAFLKECGVVLILAAPIEVPTMVFRVFLKNVHLPTRWGPLVVRNNMTRNGRNGSKDEGSDAKDAKHCEKESRC